MASKGALPSPKGKAASKPSALGMAGASMLGPSAAKAGGGLPSTGKTSPTGLGMKEPLSPTSPTSTTSSIGRGKAGLDCLGIASTSLSDLSAGGSQSSPQINGSISSGAPPVVSAVGSQSVPKANGSVGSSVAPSVAAPPAAAPPAAAPTDAAPPAAATPYTKPPAAESSKPASAPEKVPAETLTKFHSAVRWAKPWNEIKASAGSVDLRSVASEKDPKNGNTALHIAAQNGHIDLVRELLAAGSPVNAQNGKGQTPLHMTVEYDMHFVTRLLMDNGADTELTNGEGHKAVLGIEGGKSGNEAWDNPVTILRSATTPEELELAFTALEQALSDPANVSKEMLIQVGMSKKKAPNTQAIWDHKRFMKLAAQF